jgi:hypothetical protein
MRPPPEHCEGTAPPQAASLPGKDEPKPLLFSAELLALIERFDDRPVRLAALFEATQGRGVNLLLLLITLPFITPVPLPGFSIPFGVVVALLGTRMALGRKPWLPQRLLARELPPHFLGKFLRAAIRLIRGLEYFLRPRLLFVRNHTVFARIAGLLIAVSGLFLILPLPLPFSNSLPAWTVIFLAAGALGRDGLFFIAGCVSFAISIAFFTLVAFGGAELIDRVRHFFFGS